ncbi:MAG: helix-turn-helix domain-containing protein [Endozoicomonas sp.]
MPELQLAANFFSLSMVLLCIGLVFPFALRDRRALCFALLQICLLGHLLGPVFTSFSDSFWLQWSSSGLRAAIPAMFWLVCHLTFNDRFQLSARTLSIPAIVMLVPALGSLCAYLFSLEYSFIYHWTMNRLPQWLEFLLIAHALVTVIRNMRDDLVEPRREMRVWLLGGAGFYIALVVIMEQFFSGGPQTFIELQPVLLALLLLFFYGKLFRFHGDMLFHSESSPGQVQRSSETSPPQEVHTPADPVIAKLHQLMTEDQVYQQEGLTISDLAEKMTLQEYQLRRLINQQLGYRNFNDFLNGYRIHKACQRLTSEQDASLPVLTIALDTGFRSLSAFNRAFKERTGITPTQFRRSRPVIPPEPPLKAGLAQTETT